MLTFRNIALSDLNADGQLLQTLYTIFRSTLNEELSFREFKQYYFSQHPSNVKITLLMREEKVIGFCSAAFYPSKVRNRKIVIARAAVGIKNQYRGGALPTARLLIKFILYKLKHPFSTVYITGFIANPLVYAMICKYAVQVYPRRNKTVPDKIHRLKTGILQSMNLLQKEKAPFVLKIHFPVCLSEREIKRVEQSRNEHLRYYLTLNPHFTKQTGVLVLLPVNWTNVLYAGMQLLKTAFSTRVKNQLKPVYRKPVPDAPAF